MTKISSFINVLFPLFAILLCIISQCLAALSDKQLCYDSNCSEPVSMAKTIMAYVPNDRELMKFANNVDVKVFSKGAGKRKDLWGVEINGKRGFVPKSFLKEYKILRGDLSYEVPVSKHTGEVKKVQINKFESPEEVHKTQSLLTTLPLKKTSHDEASPLDKIVDKNVQESEMINTNSILSSYEIIDGTTVYLENKPSVQPSFVSEVAHATALPNKQTSDTDSKTDAGSSSDENIFINNKELQSDTDNNNKLEGIELLVKTHKNSISGTLLESSETIINSTLDIVNNNDNLALDESSEFKDESKNLKHEKAIDTNEENIENEKKEEISEDTETEGIFASLTKTLKLLSNSEETELTESITTPSSIDISVPETITENILQEQISEDVKIKDTVIEKTIPTTKIENTNIDASVTTQSKEKIEMQQKIVQTNIESTKILDEKMKTEQETSAILLENATPSNDVPLSNNFVHVNADNSVKESLVASSIDDSSDSAKVGINSHVENIQIEETSKEEKVIENILTENVISFEELTKSFDLQETTSTESTTQSNNDIHQTLLGNNKMHAENVKEDVGYTEITAQKINEIDKISENSSLLVKEMAKDVTKELLPKTSTFGGNIVITNEPLNHNAANAQLTEKLIVHNNVNKNDNLINDASFDNVPIEPNQFSNDVKPSISDSEQSVGSSQENMISEQITTFNEIPQNQNLNIEEDLEHKNIENHVINDEEISIEYDNQINSEDKILYKDDDIEEDNLEKSESKSLPDGVCSLDHECTIESIATIESLEQKEELEDKGDNLLDVKLDHNYWKTLIYLCVTVFTTLVFTLGYYYIENIRRDGQLIARINELEKELLVSTKESEVLSENLKSTKDKLNCIEDESFGSNEMVVSLKAELEESQIVRAELEDQVTTLEKELENASEAGLEIERMLREVLSSNSAVNPLAQSVEDLQARLDAQQAANESLTNALNLKAQEIETLSVDLIAIKKKCEKLEVELSQAQDELATQKNLKNDIEETLMDKVHNLEKKVNELSTEKLSLYNELKSKEIEIDGLKEVISHIKSNSLDLEKLYDVSHIKIEAVQLREERDELKMRLNDVEGAHQLLEEHTKLIKEEIVALSDQCKIAEREKKEAETKLEVLSKFFKEKEAERQKEEALWLQKQGEVVSTVERIHTMQNEIQNYKQQIEILKREIVDQEKEYKTQISALETKAHEQWVAARQNERRLEESKAEAGQLRNRLTLIEKNLNDSDAETKLHRLEANGETATSPPLFLGAESSNSPVMFSGSSGVPPPPLPSYLHCFPPYLPPLPPTASGLPPYDISQRPPPLGGRLSSPPPMPPLHPSASRGRYENAGSPPPPMSPPHLLPPFNRHRSPPPPPFGSDHIPPPPLPGSMLPPPLDTMHSWGEESLPLPRNSGFHPHQRDQRMRNHKGSLHSSGESLDKAHHGKV